MNKLINKLPAICILFIFAVNGIFSQKLDPTLHFQITFPQPANHSYNIELNCSNWQKDTIEFKMPEWMPGYYQLMNYAKTVSNITATDSKGKNLSVKKTNDHTWEIAGIKNQDFTLFYTIKTEKQFVAISYVDSAHAYLIPENTFLYIPNHLDLPVNISIEPVKTWNKIATGLTPVVSKTNEYSAPNFDILYDCPILIGKLEEFQSFDVKGTTHRFIAYKPGVFDHKLLMDKLKKIVEASVEIFVEIPYNEYTFIGIGPGRGGIEHLNNTTISFDGSGLANPETMNKMINFIAHEYFHHYNVKRIRPFELGPFNYQTENRTNLLWVSEGLTVYYEYLIVKRAGLANTETLFENFNRNITATENNPGRLFQSLQQASYATWSDGPFGTQGKDPGKSISYYDKGPVVGLFIDFEIRNATQNKKSLDDVMRKLYWTFYKEKQRGFTEAEFQAACEEVAGISLTNFFEYVYTTKELDYTKYLGYAGLKVDVQTAGSNEKGSKRQFKLSKIENPNELQKTILKSWLGE